MEVIRGPKSLERARKEAGPDPSILHIVVIQLSPSEAELQLKIAHREEKESGHRLRASPCLQN